MIKLIILLSLLFALTAEAADNRYSVSLKDWPPDIINRINRVAPEIARKDHDALILTVSDWLKTTTLQSSH
jgi:hypothetical protein